MFLRINSRCRPLCLLMVGLLCLALAGCGEEPPVKIGFLGGLTGRVADLGVAGRDGVLMAVEERNQAGGVAGRRVELLVRDDRQDEETVRAAFGELDAEQVVAIIGPMTSAMGMIVKELADSARLPVISPTVKTDRLSGQDDFFLRVTTPLSRNASRMAGYVVRDLGLKSFAVVGDASNSAFTETWYRLFAQALQENGGRIVHHEAFTSAPDLHFLPIARRVLKAKPDGVLLLSNAIDTAMLAQQFRKLGNAAPLFSSEWAFTSDLLSFGGHAVDGMTSFHSFDADSRDPRYLSFQERFQRRFGYQPSFATVLAYDAATFLFRGLEGHPSRDGLKGSLLALGSFSGLQSQIAVDRFGDVDRKLFLTVVADGRFKVLDRQ